ncbi:tetratricopeptide repeat protein 7B isoform X1 [Drosophila tropicalis]|uniref:tetratricopeptide repeat protein 7B isoform X1 n=1 Tax=Drosophila tropicalis TaxID=46794 RepID=UPI0035AC2164
MANTNRNMRNNTTKVEALIESCRSEGKWQRVIELTDELKTGSPHNECLANFLVGEARLENYLEENALPSESNFGRAKSGLAEARRFLNLALGESGQKAGIALDAYLLLAKLCFACGEYETSLDNFVKAELNTLAEKELTLRSLKILAESYAIKGLCLEQQSLKPTSKFKKAEKDTEMISCFERASDLGLLYLQEYDIVSGSNNSSNNSTAGSTLNVNALSVQQSASSFAISSTIPSAQSNATPEVNRRMGAILETALQRAPIVLIKTGKLPTAVERYRIMLNAIETRATQSLRLTLARQLAEVLLRGVSGTVYIAPFTTKSGGSTLRGGSSSKKLWKPRKYAARQQFSPKNQQEEVILLLLIAEALAVRDTVLSQSPEFRQVRQFAMGNVTAVYDLLTLATVRWGLVQLLNESFEKALKFSFGEQHIWRQYGLSLMAAEKHAQALRVLQESIKLIPSDPLPCLLASKLCYESLGAVKQGLDFAQQALKREVKGLRPTRSQLFVGIGHQQLAIQATLKSERDACHKLALEALERAVQHDGNDHLAEYYLSLQYALLNQLNEALTHIRFALALRMEHAPCLHLFALLLTASRRPREALGVVDDALYEFPDNLQLLHVKAHLQLHLEDPETALATVQHMLAVWRDNYEAQLTAEEEKHSDTKSGVHLVHSSQMSDKDSNSVYAASLAAVSRVEQALSEAASSLSSFTQKPGPRRPWMLQIEIWLLLADVYLRIDQPNEALNCIHEASQIYPLSHQIMFMRGQVHAYLDQWVDAKQCFLNAVAANPNHTEALRALGETHLILGEPRLAEKMLKDAAKLDPNCPKIWFSLGKILQTLGDYNASADCFATSLQLEPTCPVLPFTSIPLIFE